MSIACGLLAGVRIEGQVSDALDEQIRHYRALETRSHAELRVLGRSVRILGAARLERIVAEIRLAADETTR